MSNLQSLLLVLLGLIHGDRADDSAAYRWTVQHEIEGLALRFIEPVVHIVNLFVPIFQHLAVLLDLVQDCSVLSEFVDWLRFCCFLFFLNLFLRACLDFGSHICCNVLLNDTILLALQLNFFLCGDSLILSCCSSSLCSLLRVRSCTRLVCLHHGG